MQQAKTQKAQKPQSDNSIATQCYICKRGGSHFRWQLCENNHYQSICNDCVVTLDSGLCIVSDCGAKTHNNLIKHVMIHYVPWMKNLTADLQLLEKYYAISGTLVGLHHDTRESFRQSVETFIQVKPGNARSVCFQNYLQKLTAYVINVRLACCREDMTHIIEQDDQANSELSSRIEKYEELNQMLKKASGRINLNKESLKIQKYPINCLICFNSYNVLYNWTYCENAHPHNSVCRECLYKIKECPVCRGQLRTNIIKTCQDSMKKWDITLNQHISINEMINLIMKDTLSKDSRHTIYAKIKKLNGHTKAIELGDYPRLIKNLSMEWCHEFDREKHERIFKMIQAYEQEYELLIDLKKIIAEKLNEYVTRQSKQVALDTSNSSSDIESSYKSEEDMQVPLRSLGSRSFRMRSAYRYGRSRQSSHQLSSVSRGRRSRSRSRSRDHHYRRQISRSRSRELPPALPAINQAEQFIAFQRAPRFRWNRLASHEYNNPTD